MKNKTKKISKRKILKELKIEVMDYLNSDCYSVAGYYVEIARKIYSNRTIENSFLYTSSTDTALLKTLKPIDYDILDYLKQNKLLDEIN